MIRACSPQEVTRWISFLDRAFQYEAGSFGIDFSPLFSAKNLQNSRLYFEDGEIASSATLYPERACINGKYLNVGIIGAVATRQESRGRGHAQALLLELENLAQSLGLDAVVLWSDQLEYYAKNGYQKYGAQEIYSLYTMPRISESITVSKSWAAHLDDVKKAYAEHRMRIDRTEDQWKNVMSISSVQYRCSKTVEGKFAYLAYNRGKDMQNIIHEWGGDDTVLRLLINQSLNENPDLLWLTHPKIGEDPIRKLLSPLEKPVLSNHLGLTKVFNSAASSLISDLWFWGLDSL